MSKKSSKLKTEGVDTRIFFQRYPFLYEHVFAWDRDLKISEISSRDLLRCHIKVGKLVKGVDEHYRDFCFFSGDGTAIHMIKGVDCESDSTLGQYLGDDVLFRTAVVQVFMYARQRSRVGGDYSVDDFGYVFFVLAD